MSTTDQRERILGALRARRGEWIDAGLLIRLVGRYFHCRITELRAAGHAIENMRQRPHGRYVVSLYRLPAQEGRA